MSGGEDQDVRWRVPTRVPVGKLAVAAIVAAAALAAGADPWLWVAVLVVAAGLVFWAVRDLVAPVRLAADPAGVTVVTGFATRHRLGWSQVERVRVDVRRWSRLLEVDAGARLYLFSRYEVDEDLHEVARRLEAWRVGDRGAAGSH